MNKLIVVGLCSIIWSLAVADATTPTNTNAATTKARLPRGATRFGGLIVKPNSQQGTIGVLNSQTIVPADKCKELMERFAKEYRLAVKFAECGPVTPKSATTEMKKAGVQVAVFLTGDQDPDAPLYISAPDSHWSIVNVAAVTKGARNDTFAAARTRKAIMRAFMCAAGAMDSQYPNSMMRPLKSAEDLDLIIETLPVDAINRSLCSLKSAGVTPLLYVPYKRACEEGWAPRPTVDYQQKIWDEVHKAPTSPIVIKPETVQQK